MKYSTKLSDAVHILALIALADTDVTSTEIANSICTNPSFVRQMMSKLKKAGLIISVTGHAKPRLSVSPEKITLCDIYKAVEGTQPLLHLDTHTNPNCGVGVNIQLALKKKYDDIQRKVEQYMNDITLAEILHDYALVVW